MPCCMLGAIFLGQCLAVWSWIKRRLGFDEAAKSERRGILGVLGCRPKTVLLIVCLELVLGGAVLAYTGQELRGHAEHHSAAPESLPQLQKNAICRAGESPKSDKQLTSIYSKGALM